MQGKMMCWRTKRPALGLGSYRTKTVTMDVSVLHIVHLFQVLMSYLGTGAGNTILLVNDSQSWTGAHDFCKNGGGYLLNSSLMALGVPITEFPNCARDFDNYWTGRISVRTHFLTLKGCFEEMNSSFVSDEREFQDNSVELCFLHCNQRNKKRILIKENKCACGTSAIDSNLDFNFSPLHASACNVNCGGRGQFCGGHNAVNIYTEEGKLKGEGKFTEDCGFTSCEKNKAVHSADYCEGENLDESLILCDNNTEKTVQMPNTSDWFVAMAMCPTYASSPFSDDNCIKNSQLSTGKSFWTRRRRYRGTIQSFDLPSGSNEILEERDHWFEYVIRGNITWLSSTSVNDKKRKQGVVKKAFICVLDSTNITDSDNCIVSLENEADTMTTTSDALFTSEGEDLRTIYGIVIGLSVGVTVLMIVISVKVWHMIKSKKPIDMTTDERRNRSSENNGSYDECGDVSQIVNPLHTIIYEESKEGEYDTARTKRKRVGDSDNKTNHYSEVNVALKASDTGNEYEISFSSVKTAIVKSVDVYDDVICTSKTK